MRVVGVGDSLDVCIEILIILDEKFIDVNTKFIKFNVNRYVQRVLAAASSHRIHSHLDEFIILKT